MALYQLLPPAHGERDNIYSNTYKLRPIKQPKTKYQLLESSEVPSWYAHNTFLRTGYRPVTGSTRLCFESLQYIHNETVNIYSHLVPAGIAVIGNGLLHLYFRAHYENTSWTDQLAFHIYLSSSVLCFGISSFYHTLLCHSEAYMDLWCRLDYLSIVLQTLGSFISGIYFSFYCEPGLQELYWTMIGVLGLLTATIVVNPRFQSAKYRTLRLSTFIATGLSAFAPIIHAVTIFPYAQLTQQTGLGYYLVEGLALITGTIFYASRPIFQSP
ncbi:hypothetical protein FQN49_005659 [Arthroderma sp. PD_2]|nr:hypothetical protein FQN49_005659 [Arthroderma sp. PD_2]